MKISDMLQELSVSAGISASAYFAVTSAVKAPRRDRRLGKEKLLEVLLVVRQAEREGWTVHRDDLTM